MTSISTTALPAASALDEVLGNTLVEGVRRTRRAPIGDLAAQLAAGGAVADAIAGLDAAISGGLTAEEEARIAGDAGKAPQALLDAETASRIQGDANEAAVRTAAIQQLSADISAVSAVASVGLKPFLAPCRLMVTTDVDLTTAAEAGDTLDGLVLAAGDRMVKAFNGETGAATNGFWIVQASGAAVRAAEADTSGELIGARCQIAAGTHAGKVVGVANTAAITVGTTPVVIREFSGSLNDQLTAALDTRIGPGAALGYNADTDLTQPLLTDSTGKKALIGVDAKGRLLAPMGIAPRNLLAGAVKFNAAALGRVQLKLKAMAAGSALTLTGVALGDSWIEKWDIAQALKTMLAGLAGGGSAASGATGWLSLGAELSGTSAAFGSLKTLDAAAVTKSGPWTRNDGTEVTANTFWGLDGFYYTATGTASAFTFANFTGASFDLYYRDTNGTFRYSIDGAAPVTVAGGNTGNPMTVTIGGLGAGTHTVVVDTTGNGGTVGLYGARAYGLPGVEINKCGNGSAIAPHFTLWAGTARAAQMAAMAPDFATILVGTNDVQLARGISDLDYKAALQAEIDRLKTAAADIGILLILPPANGGANALSTRVYSRAVADLAMENANVGFLNLAELWPAYAQTNAIPNMWAAGDTLHPGTLMIAAIISQMKSFFTGETA